MMPSSTIPYEKGFLISSFSRPPGWRENFDGQFILLITSNEWAPSLWTSYDFKATFLEFFDAPEYAGLRDKIASINWEESLLQHRSST